MMAGNTLRPAIFFDRDGVLIRDKRYTYKPKDIELVKNCKDTLQYLKSKNFYIFVITNQSGVAREFFSLNQVSVAHQELQKKLGPEVLIDHFFVCPHYQSGLKNIYAIDCICRKPKTGLLELATTLYDFDIKNTWLVGDRKTDIDCAKNFNIKSVQYINSQYDLHPSPDHSIRNLSEIKNFI